jgi:hypothetical protein
MDSHEMQTRSVLAHEVAKCLIYHSVEDSLISSPVHAARHKVHELFSQGELPEAEHDELSTLLLDLENCDMDSCERVDDLVTNITRSLAAWPEEFPREELERLRKLI